MSNIAKPSGAIHARERRNPAKDTPPLFDLGTIVVTPGALNVFNRLGLSASLILTLHQRGDFGDLEPTDICANLLAIKSGSRILSAYIIDNATKIWAITEADRSATTILLPSEY